MATNVQVYDEQNEPNKDKKRPDRRRYHHLQSAVWLGGRYASNGNIVGPE
jgi:hypothetical protein